MPSIPNDVILFVVGTTASGKKEIGLRLARELGAEVLFMDSVKVYQGMRIGAAMPTEEELRSLRTHLLEIAPPDEAFSLGRYVSAAQVAVKQVRDRGAIPLFLGGTPLYLQSLLRGFFDGPAADPRIRTRLDEEASSIGLPKLHARLGGIDADAAGRIAPTDRKRIFRALEVFELTGKPITQLQREQTRPALDGEVRMIGLRNTSDAQENRQALRVDRMLRDGLVAEVQALRESGRLTGEASRAIGYREIVRYLDGECTLADARDEIITNTRRLDRKQRKWLRRFSEIRWVDREPNTPVEDILAAAMARAKEPGERVDPTQEGTWFQ